MNVRWNVAAKEAGMRQLRWVLITVCACAVARFALADSLWGKDGESMYRDKKAFKVGDVLTVNVVESASASHQVGTNSEKVSASGVSWGSRRSSAIPFADFEIKGNEDVRGSGRSTRRGNLTGKITVRVAEVLPNGNLVIDGERVIVVNDEKQVMEITGIVRADDVSSENAVLSTHIADAQIKYSGRGAISEKAKLGLISRLLSMLAVF